MMYQLKKMFNTRYLYVTFNLDLNNCFNDVLKAMEDNTYVSKNANPDVREAVASITAGANVEFDLAECVLSRDCANTIHNFAMRGIRFVDTKDICRNKVLEDNRARAEWAKLETVELPDFRKDMVPIEYIRSLDKDTIYSMPIVDDGGIYLRLAYVITCCRPKIKLVLGKHERLFFDLIGKRLTLNDIKDYTEFYFCSDSGVQIVDFSRPVYLQRMGEVSMETALTCGYLIPTIVGQEKLLDIKCFRRIFEDCLNVLDSYCATRKRKLSEVIQGVKK